MKRKINDTLKKVEHTGEVVEESLAFVRGLLGAAGEITERLEEIKGETAQRLKTAAIQGFLKGKAGHSGE